MRNTDTFLNHSIPLAALEYVKDADDKCKGTSNQTHVLVGGTTGWFSAYALPPAPSTCNVIDLCQGRWPI